MIVVSRLPASTMNMTGFLICTCGSSFLMESRIAGRTMAGSQSEGRCACVLMIQLFPVEARGVEREVEFQDVDARSTEEAERWRLGVRAYECPNPLQIQPARTRDAGGLKLGGGRRNMGIQAGATRRNHLRRHLRRFHILLLRHRGQSLLNGFQV